MLTRHTPLKVGKTYLEFLLDSGDFEEAADLCTRIFKNEKKLWQDEAIVRFNYILCNLLRKAHKNPNCKNSLVDNAA